MKRIILALAFSAVASGCFTTGLPEKASSPPVAPVPAEHRKSAPNIILIGWDGAQRNHINEMISGKELPVLTKLSAEGALIDIDVVTGATDTKAGWTQILTGYAPEKTGVYSNGRYDTYPEGYSIFERAEKFLGDENIETRAFIGKSSHVDADPPRKIPYDEWVKEQEHQKKIDKKKPGLGKGTDNVKTVEENGVKYAILPGKPHYYAKKNMDLFVNGLKENENVGNMALKNLEECAGKQFLFFVHFAEPDHSGHKHGENSKEYTDAIKSDDEWTGKIINKVRELGVYDKTLIYIVVDHGFNEGESGHSYAPFVFLATNDKTVNRNGVREDIAPTILKKLGIDLKGINPALDGTPLDEPAAARKAPRQKAMQDKKGQREGKKKKK